jgi:hypothetical protein
VYSEVLTKEKGEQLVIRKQRYKPLLQRLRCRIFQGNSQPMEQKKAMSSGINLGLIFALGAVAISVFVVILAATRKS